MNQEYKRYYAEQDHNRDAMSKNSWFDLPISSFHGRPGNIFLIKKKFDYDEYEDPKLVTEYEHNDVHILPKTKQEIAGTWLESAKILL